MATRSSCDIQLLARAVESAVFGALMNASLELEREDYWRAHADKLERKFTTEHGRHYSYFLPEFSPAN